MLDGARSAIVRSVSREAQFEALTTQSRILHLEQRSEEQAKHHSEHMFDLQRMMERLANEHALAVAEQQIGADIRSMAP